MARQTKTWGEYDKNERWAKKNLRRYGFSVNKNTDRSLIEFVDKASQFMGQGEVLRMAVKFMMAATDDLAPVAKYTADNGDEFIRIMNSNIPQPDIEIGNCKEYKVKAEHRMLPVEHTSYYLEDGTFVGTAGTHIHEKLGLLTEFLFTKRTSQNTENDTITKILGYTD